LVCKWHKANGVKGTLSAQTQQEQLARLDEADARADLGDDSVSDEELARALSWRRPPRLENDLAMRTKFRRRLAQGDLRTEL
jgi:hypothetical protein